MIGGIGRAMLPIVKGASRYLLRRPIVGVAAAARTHDGRWLLVQRRDVGHWALAGGTLEWGETLHGALARELAEEAGIDRFEMVRLVGVFSRPDRDPRFHAVTFVFECIVEEPARPPDNPLEIAGVGLFAETSLPPSLAMGMADMLEAARRGAVTVVE